MGDKPEAGTEGTEKPAGSGTEQQPPEGEEKDLAAEVAKWKAMSRKHEAEAKTNADAARRLKEAEEADKSEIQKALEGVATEKKLREEADLKVMRLEIAIAKGLPAKLMKYLGGSTKEEMEESADELLEAVKPGSESKEPGSGKPKEALRPGAAGSDKTPEATREERLKQIPRL